MHDDLAFLDDLLAHDQPPIWKELDDDSAIDRHLEPARSLEQAARAERLANEQARIVVAAIGETEQRSRFYQPFEGAVILRDGKPWWGFFFCCGVFMPNGAQAAHRAIIEREHLEALRRNDWLDRLRVHFELTDKGRQALAASEPSGAPAVSARRVG